MQRAQYCEDEIVSDEETLRSQIISNTAGNTSSRVATKPVTTSSSPTPGRETRSMTAATAAAAAAAASSLSSPTSTSSCLPPSVPPPSRMVSSPNVSHSTTVSTVFLPSTGILTGHMSAPDVGRRTQDVGTHPVHPPAYAQGMYPGGAGHSQAMHEKHSQLGLPPAGHLHQGPSHIILSHPGLSHPRVTEVTNLTTKALSWHPSQDYPLKLNPHPNIGHHGSMSHVPDSSSEQRGVEWGGPGLSRVPPRYPNSVKSETNLVLSHTDSISAHGKRRTGEHFLLSIKSSNFLLARQKRIS